MQDMLRIITGVMLTSRDSRVNRFI